MKKTLTLRPKAQEQFFATCPRGLEPVLAQELMALGMEKVMPIEGGVHFAGVFTQCYRVNLESRTASRVLWRVTQTAYRSEDDVYRAVVNLPWEKWFSPDETIAVKVTAKKCSLKSLEFITLRIKDAVCDHFRDVAGRRPSVDTRLPDVRIHAFLDAVQFTLYLDTSGETLFKRGYRQAAGEAPLRENLAAGILQLAGWQSGVPLFDPMCGSGTFLQEAALQSLNWAPGLRRDFGFERLRNFDRKVWTQMQTEADARRRAAKLLEMHGSDVDHEAIQIAQRNIEQAGLGAAITLKVQDVLDATPPSATPGVLVMNPPYGERIGEQETLAELYPKLGSVLKQRFAGWKVAILTADTRLPTGMRLKPSRKIPLFNGPIECRLYLFEMVEGSNRDKKTGVDKSKTK